MSNDGILRGLPPIPDPRPLPGENDHARFHRASNLPTPSVLCARCNTMLAEAEASRALDGDTFSVDRAANPDDYAPDVA